MAEKKSLVEEAILQMKNLEDIVSENAKGILASTMRQEIKELVKESLKEQDDEEVEDEEDDMDIEDDTMDVEDEDMYDMGMEDDTDIEDDDMDMSEPDMEVDTIDLTNQPASEVLRVFKLLSPEDEIVVTKDTAGNINLKDKETNKEYMIVSEGMDEYDKYDEMYHSDMMELDDYEDLMEMGDTDYSEEYEEYNEMM